MSELISGLDPVSRLVIPIKVDAEGSIVTTQGAAFQGDIQAATEAALSSTLPGFKDGGDFVYLETRDRITYLSGGGTTVLNAPGQFYQFSFQDYRSIALQYSLSIAAASSIVLQAQFACNASVPIWTNASPDNVNLSYNTSGNYSVVIQDLPAALFRLTVISITGTASVTAYSFGAHN